MKRWIGRVLTSLVAVIGLTLAGFAARASANPAYWDWGDNHELCASGCVRSGNLVRLWQSILWVDGYDHGLGTSFIDGEFGPNTHNETFLYQYINIGDNQADGRVGPITWGYAESVGFCDDSSSGSYHFFTYCGHDGAPYRTVQMRQHISTGEWWFINPRTGSWTGTNHA